MPLTRDRVIRPDGADQLFRRPDAAQEGSFAR
jgi:hypothetical protein